MHRLSRLCTRVVLDRLFCGSTVIERDLIRAPRLLLELHKTAVVEPCTLLVGFITRLEQHHQRNHGGHAVGADGAARVEL